jgi:hypothetical protein
MNGLALCSLRSSIVQEGPVLELEVVHSASGGVPLVHHLADKESAAKKAAGDAGDLGTEGFVERAGLRALGAWEA